MRESRDCRVNYCLSSQVQLLTCLFSLLLCSGREHENLKRLRIAVVNDVEWIRIEQRAQGHSGSTATKYGRFRPGIASEEEAEEVDGLDRPRSFLARQVRGAARWPGRRGLWRGARAGDRQMA